MDRLKTNFRIHYRISGQAFREDIFISGNISEEIIESSAWGRIQERHPGITREDVKILYIYPFNVWTK